jgi:pimeloyl-ACP methyl ester carboxylesterase
LFQFVERILFRFDISSNNVSHMIPWIFLTFLVVISGVIAFSYIFARSALRVPRRPRENNPNTIMPLQPIEVQGQAGTLRGWFVSHGSKQPTILLTHGWGRNSAQMMPFAEFLFVKGYNLCLFDVRGHGNSDPHKDGLVIMPRFAEDIISMAKYCRTRADVDPARLGHLGHSMGAASSFFAERQGKLFRCMVASSGFADLRDLVRWMLRAARLPSFPFQSLILFFWRRTSHFTFDDLNPVSILPSLHLPVLIAHGDQDAVVPFSQFHKLKAHATNGNVHAVFVRGKGHSELYTDASYVSAVQEFFAKHL